MNKLLVGLAAIAGLYAVPMSSAQADIILDNFRAAGCATASVGGGVVTCAGGAVGNPAAVMVGGVREYEATGTAGSQVVFSPQKYGDAGCVVGCVGAALVPQNGSGGAGTGHLYYDGGADGSFTPLAGALGLDLSSKKALRILTGLGDEGLPAAGTVDFQWDLWDNLGNTDSVSFSTAGFPILTFLDTNLSLFSGIDLSNIAAISLTVDGHQSADVEFLELSATVPEPSTIAVFGVGLIGLGAAHRRRRARRAA